MANHFSTIGFPLSDKRQFVAYAKLCMENGTVIKRHSGAYHQWQVGNGVELWAQTDPEDHCVGLNPHFSGNAEIRIRADHFIHRESDSPLDGALYAFAGPHSDDPDAWAYPFVFDLPNAACAKQTLPKTVMARITGFAHTLSAYPDEQTFQDSQGDKPGLASQAFLPVGLFSEVGEAANKPKAMALMTGRILETAPTENPHTGMVFHVLTVETYGGQYTIVADPTIIQGQLRRGGIIEGTFWLTGTLTEANVK